MYADIPMPPTRLPAMTAFAPDLVERARHGRPWTHVRRAVAARWWRVHTSAARALAIDELVGAHYAEFTCIARHEAGDGRTTASIRWDISTGNGYYGGLQMDRTFAAAYDPVAYAKLGTPDRWSQTRQRAAAERAWRVRGFTPWPNTARACGLL